MVEMKTAPKAAKVSSAKSITELAGVQQEGARLLEERLKATQKSEAELKDVSIKLNEALAAGNLDAVKALSVTFADVRARSEATTRDVSGAVMNLMNQFKEIGTALESASDFTAAEQKLITEAEALVARMQGRLDLANTDLAAADRKTSWFGIRNNAVSAAQAAIRTAQNDLEGAKAGVGTATQVAERMRQQRLESMSLEGSMQQMQVISQRLVGIARSRIEEIEGNISVITTGRIAANASLETLAAEVATLEAQVTDAEASIRTLDAELAEQTPGTVEYQQIDSKIADAKRTLIDAQNERNRKFSLQQDGQRFAEMYRLQEEVQSRMLEFQKTWIELLESGTRARSEIYESRLGVIRARGDQAAMNQYDTVATQVDERMHSDTAADLAAMQKTALDRLKRAPDDFARIRKITDASQGGTEEFEKGFNSLVEQFRRMQDGAEAPHDAAA